jgi:hypothetical protein
VTDKGSGIAVGDTEANGNVDEVGEECDAVFKVVMGHLHDTGGELKNSDLWVVLELGDGIEKAVHGDFSVRVNCMKSVFAHRGLNL